MSKNIGTPVHGEYLKSDGYRRHKARCIYYNKKQNHVLGFLINVLVHLIAINIKNTNNLYIFVYKLWLIRFSVV